MEFSFPWETLGGKPGKDFDFSVSAGDRRDMPHGKIGWLSESSTFTGEIMLEKEALDDNKKHNHC